jgi:ferritin-like metal-binding protein YciE
MATTKTMIDLLLTFMQDVYYAERQILKALPKMAEATCEAINGLIEEGEEVIEEFPEGPVRDAGIVACAQAVEHYEMARYGTIVAWAKAVGADDVAQLMQETLEGERRPTRH